MVSVFWAHSLVLVPERDFGRLEGAGLCRHIVCAGWHSQHCIVKRRRGGYRQSVEVHSSPSKREFKKLSMD
jgi:hypothetical protein